ncbi:MAG: zinc-finger domain-containing protein [Caulobacterales bacterium]|uniref:zinc-finger domain-containing protein n=1 Tax=Glycocaulis sp. TaxID=1969725 RepID=UPI003FA0741D
MASTRAKTPAKPGKAPVAKPASFPAPEIIEVSTSRVMCDGGGGALGHPRVWYDMGDEGFVECGYCDRRFVLKAGASGH